MDVRKQVLDKLKNTDVFIENENLIALQSVIDNCIGLLEKSIKEDEERASQYMNGLLKDLK